MDSCNVYINERSIATQCADVKEAEGVVRTIIKCISILNSCDSTKVEIRKYYCGLVFTNALLQNGLCVQKLADKDLKLKFKLVLKDAINWVDNPLTDNNAKYIHKGFDVSFSSMSEAYENNMPILVNFAKSSISEPVATVMKQGGTSVDIASLSDCSLISNMIIKKGWRKKEYDLSSSIPPRDEESILSDSNKFEPTVHRYNGRIIYRQKGTNLLLYIDRKHSGKAAHIEVFNEATKKQERTLNINEETIHHELSTNEKGRTLKFDS